MSLCLLGADIPVQTRSTKLVSAGKKQNMLLGSLTGKGILGLVREGSSTQLRPIGRKGLAWEDFGEECSTPREQQPQSPPVRNGEMLKRTGRTGRSDGSQRRRAYRPGKDSAACPECHERHWTL